MVSLGEVLKENVRIRAAVVDAMDLLEAVLDDLDKTLRSENGSQGEAKDRSIQKVEVAPRGIQKD